MTNFNSYMKNNSSHSKYKNDNKNQAENAND